VWVPEARYRYRQHAASFLAEHGAKVALEHDVAILRLHARPIREAGAMAAYLRQKILPQLTADIRHGRWLAALRVMRGLMPCAGRELIAGLRSYYTGRLRIRAGVGEQP
jgi:hypothetical protein